MTKVSVILNGYNRGYLLNKQIESVRNQTLKPNEIMIWYNKGEKEQIKINDHDIKVVYSDFNFKFHGRFAFALLAKSDYISIFDDDVIPGKMWLEHSLEYCKKLNGIIGSSGVYLKSDNYENNIKYGYNGVRNINDVKEVDLVGHTWVFKREWLHYMWIEYPVSWDNGEDIQFSYSCKKYGNIKTYVPPLTENKDNWGNSNIRYGADEFASWRKSNHSELRDSIVKQLIDKGWKTVQMLKNK